MHIQIQRSAPSLQAIITSVHVGGPRVGGCGVLFGCSELHPPPLLLPPLTHSLKFPIDQKTRGRKKAKMTLSHTSGSLWGRMCVCLCVCAFNHVCDLNPRGVANQYRLDEYWQALIKDSLSKPSVSSCLQNGDCMEENTSFSLDSVCMYVCVCADRD